MGQRAPKNARTTKSRKVPTTIYVGRNKGTKDFTACVRIGKTRAATGYTKGTYTCSRATNPRAAVAHALKLASEAIGKRSGTYRGSK